MKLSNLLSLLFLCSSCSYFIGKIDSPLVDDRDYLKNIPEKSSYCAETQKADLQLVGTEGNAQTVYLSLVQRSSERLDLLDHFALWSLLQLSARPDQSSPTSRFQILLNFRGKTHYFDFLSEQTDLQYPYLYGLEWVLKKFNKNRSLENYGALLQRSLGSGLKIGKDFETFLVKNQNFIKENEQLSPYFFRGNEVLKENETTPKLDYLAVIKQYRQNEKLQRIVVNSTLAPFITEQANQGSCNYDFNLYSNSIFLIDKIIPIANLFGLSVKEGAFMASSSQKLEKAESLHGQPLFKGESKVRSTAVCVIEKDDNKIWTFSNQSRDPGQHLFHLVRYGLPQSQSIYEVDRLLRHSRHIFLSDPVRLVIESQRSRQDQIENLLKLNLPIYNSPKLGNVWAYALFQNNSRFIIDDRNPGAFVCQ